MSCIVRQILILCTSRKSQVNHFKVDNSVAFSALNACNHSFYLVPKNSHHSKGKLLTHQVVYAHSPLLPVSGNQSLISVLNRFVDGFIYSGYSYK